MGGTFGPSDFQHDLGRPNAIQWFTLFGGVALCEPSDFNPMVSTIRVGLEPMVPVEPEPDRFAATDWWGHCVGVISFLPLPHACTMAGGDRRVLSPPQQLFL